MNNEDSKENNTPNIVNNKRYPSFESIKSNTCDIILNTTNKQYKG